jgi:ketosteroid isomerase-like protein
MTTFIRRLWLASAVGILAPGTMHAQASIDPLLRAELVQAREAVWRAFFQGDSAALVMLLPERMIAMDENRAGIIHDAIGFARNGGKYVGMEFTDETFFVDGNSAVLWSHYVAHLTDGAGKATEMKGRAIELFVKQDGRWVNPHWHLDAEKAP